MASEPDLSWLGHGDDSWRFENECQLEIDLGRIMFH